MKGEQRTVEDLLEANRRWRLPKKDGGGGGDRALLQHYDNAEFPCLLPTTPDSSSTLPHAPTTIMSRLPLPLLHNLKLNTVNHLLEHFGRRWEGLIMWLKEIHVVKDDYFGGTFEGESFQLFLCSIYLANKYFCKPLICRS